MDHFVGTFSNIADVSLPLPASARTRSAPPRICSSASPRSLFFFAAKRTPQPSAGPVFGGQVTGNFGRNPPAGGPRCAGRGRRAPCGARTARGWRELGGAGGRHPASRRRSAGPQACGLLTSRTLAQPCLRAVFLGKLAHRFERGGDDPFRTPMVAPVPEGFATELVTQVPIFQEADALLDAALRRFEGEQVLAGDERHRESIPERLGDDALGGRQVLGNLERGRMVQATRPDGDEGLLQPVVGQNPIATLDRRASEAGQQCPSYSLCWALCALRWGPAPTSSLRTWRSAPDRDSLAPSRLPRVWNWKSRRGRTGRPPIDSEIAKLVRSQPGSLLC